MSDDPSFGPAWSPPRGLALVVGIDAYDAAPELRSAVADAHAITAVLESLHGFELITLTKPKHTVGASPRMAIKGLVDRLTADPRPPTDRGLLVYFAGHGVALDAGESGPQGFLLPSDARPDELATMLPMQWVHDELAALECGHLLLILDCCFAGSFRWSTTRNIAESPRRLFPIRLHRYGQ